MIRFYIMMLVIGLLGAAAYGAKSYYKSTQATIAALRENNAKLEIAIETAEQSMNIMKDEMARNQELMSELSVKLQKAEQYGDDLRNKLRQMDLVQDAIKDPEKLEGKMNGATANLWRSITEDTGGTPDPDLPDWLQPREQTGARDSSGDQSRENSSTDGSSPETSSTD